MSKKVVSINDSEKYEEVKQSRRKKANRALITHSTALFLFSCILITAALYLTSIYAKINVVQFEGLNVISKGEIIELLGINYRDIVAGTDFDELNKKIMRHPLIETAKIEPTLEGVKISVKEKEIFGCFISEQQNFPITKTGDLIDYGAKKVTPCYGITFYDLETDRGTDSIKMFVSSLAKMERSFLQRIEYIKQEPNFDDFDRYSIQMREGITVKVNAYTMSEKIGYYDQIIDRIRSTYGNITGTLHLDVGDRFEADVDLVEIRGNQEESNEEN